MLRLPLRFETILFCSTGVGGDCFALFYNGKTQEVEGLNGSGRSPMALSEEELVRRSSAAGAASSPSNAAAAAQRTISSSVWHAESVHCVTVPGMRSFGWFAGLELFFSRFVGCLPCIWFFSAHG